MSFGVEFSLRENLKTSLEIDTVVSLEASTSHNKTGLNVCYKLLKRLLNCADIVPEVTWDDATASEYGQDANFFQFVLCVSLKQTLPDESNLATC